MLFFPFLSHCISLKLIEEMSTSAGLQCEVDPVLCQALRVHKGSIVALVPFSTSQNQHLYQVVPTVQPLSPFKSTPSTLEEICYPCKLLLTPISF